MDTLDSFIPLLLSYLSFDKVSKAFVFKCFLRAMK